MGDRVRIAHIRLHRMDLADVAKWLQMKRKIRTAYRDPDPPATLRQSTHHMPTDEAGTAEHSYEPTCLHQFVRHGADPRLQSCVALECFDRKWNLGSAAGIDFVPGFDGRAEFQRPERDRRNAPICRPTPSCSDQKRRSRHCRRRCRYEACARTGVSKFRVFQTAIRPLPKLQSLAIDDQMQFACSRTWTALNRQPTSPAAERRMIWIRIDGKWLSHALSGHVSRRVARRARQGDPPQAANNGEGLADNGTRWLHAEPRRRGYRRRGTRFAGLARERRPSQALAGWRAQPRKTPGGQAHYSSLAIETALTLRAVFKLALRQSEG
jgi:hypothetical protein